MAQFIGTVQEFHHFIGPKIRNAVNGITRNHRLQRNGYCEDCGSNAELHSAHVHGKGRREIIEQELLRFIDERGVVSCSLEDIESNILKAHLPIESTFRFLCHTCHVRYDSAPNQNLRPTNSKTDHAPAGGEFLKLSRIKLWASRPQQINHKIVRAFLQLENNGEVEYSALQRHCTENLRIPGFAGHYASMKTDAGNAHGKVFFNIGSKVRMWDRARSEVDAYFIEI
jgi:hypothetical protein